MTNSSCISAADCSSDLPEKKMIPLLLATVLNLMLGQLIATPIFWSYVSLSEVYTSKLLLSAASDGGPLQDGPGRSRPAFRDHNSTTVLRTRPSTRTLDYTINPFVAARSRAGPSSVAETTQRPRTSSTSEAAGDLFRAFANSDFISWLAGGSDLLNSDLDEPGGSSRATGTHIFRLISDFSLGWVYLAVVLLQLVSGALAGEWWGVLTRAIAMKAALSRPAEADGRMENGEDSVPDHAASRSRRSTSSERRNFIHVFGVSYTMLGGAVFGPAVFGLCGIVAVGRMLGSEVVQLSGFTGLEGLVLAVGVRSLFY